MNSQTVARKTELVNPANLSRRINNLLEHLGSKVKNFAVLDKKGQLLGEVRELILDAENRLNLVISPYLNQHGRESNGKQLTNGYRLLKLRSKRIQKIDSPTQSIFVDLEKSEIENLPENLSANTQGGQIMSDVSNGQVAKNPTINSQLETANLSEFKEEEIIQLLEERLVVNSSKRKVGDVIVRKEIETRMVQVPVRREKLIVEQVSPEHKQLAEIDLGGEEITGIEFAEGEIPEVASLHKGLTVSGLFTSPKIASLLLNAIALEKQTGCQQVQVSIIVDNEEYRQKYQEWFDRCSQGQAPKS
jgi:stress response protein YsnF